MSKMLEYKPLECRGYPGSVAYSDEDEVWHGRLEFIRDLATYEGMDAKSLEATFQEAVEDYLELCKDELCKDEGRKPDEPLEGSCNVRPGRDLHRRAML